MNLVPVIVKHPRILEGKCVLGRHVKYHGALLNPEKHYYVEHHDSECQKDILARLSQALTARKT